MKLTPTAVYTAPDFETPKEFHPGDGPHSTYGLTNQISDIVIKAGGEDRDKPSEHNDTVLGNLRAEVTTLQDQINIFLTERMRLENDKANGGDVERRILDEGVEEEEIE
ncbi:EKC/KEOPS complex subunit GON7 [Candida viswanathii]|uniref:EKC/KEOPS complex subunit GON7 n=1 Tax=Candida viswanathii TaxID=5486 RepID=A0A367XQT5_9ASCO|nr:EKC/KEOPS complex subunit GON7 [Candida viswanathii]